VNAAQKVTYSSTPKQPPGYHLLSPTERSELLQDPNRFVSDRVAAQILGMPWPTLRRWRHEGRGPKYSKQGSSVRYRIAWLQEYITAHVVETRDSLQLGEADA
jgi:predicted DNA-binding transcriptional regulator AlpA